jgi:hypothetical protein
MALSLLAALLTAHSRCGFDHLGTRLSFVSDDGQELVMTDREGNTLSFMYSGADFGDGGITGVSAQNDGFAALSYVIQSFMFSFSSENGLALTFSDGSRLTGGDAGRFMAGAHTSDEPRGNDWLLYQKARGVRDYRLAVYGARLWLACGLGCLFALSGGAALTFKNGRFWTVTGLAILAAAVIVPVLSVL